MVDALDSKSSLARGEGSSPSSGTKTIEPRACLLAIIVFAGEGLEGERGHPVSDLDSLSAAIRNRKHSCGADWVARAGPRNFPVRRRWKMFLAKSLL